MANCGDFLKDLAPLSVVKSQYTKQRTLVVKLRCVLSPILWPLQACWSQGCWGSGHPQIVANQRGQIMPTTLPLATQIFRPSYGPDIAWIKYSPDILLTKRKNSFVNKKGATFDIGIGLLCTCFSIKKYCALLPLQVSYKTRDFQFNFTHITSYFAPGPQFISNL